MDGGVLWELEHGGQPLLLSVVEQLVIVAGCGGVRCQCCAGLEPRFGPGIGGLT